MLLTSVSLIRRKNTHPEPRSPVCHLVLRCYYRCFDFDEGFSLRKPGRGFLSRRFVGGAIPWVPHPIVSVPTEAHVGEELVFQCLQLGSRAKHAGEVVHGLTELDRKHNRWIDDVLAAH